MSTPSHSGDQSRIVLHTAEGIGSKTLEKIVLAASLELSTEWDTGPAQVVDPVAVVEFLAHDLLGRRLQPNRAVGLIEIVACQTVLDRAVAAVHTAAIEQGLTVIDYPHPPNYPAGAPYSRIEKPQH